MSQTIVIDQYAPVAKPEAKSLTLTTDWEIIVEPPQYEVPESNFAGGSTRLAQGSAEVQSPLWLCNRAGAPVTVSARITRENGQIFMLADAMRIEKNDVFIIPLNGMLLLNTPGLSWNDPDLDAAADAKIGDRLEVKASAVDSVDATISWVVGKSEEDNA